MHYFAYGSNMSHKQMAERCVSGRHRFVGLASLVGFTFVFDGYSINRKGPVANIVGGNGKVWGGVFEIDLACRNDLDKAEGYPNTYDRREMPVQMATGETVSAWVYLRQTPLSRGKPPEDYRGIILEGAQDCGLPADYIHEYLQA
jgi:gamma-glutamylcyclotransferase (GGCT)/AIG2-like uncharacterized protein YtfP